MEASQERKTVVNRLEVNYKIAGQGQPILILHGWGSSSDSWIEVQRNLVQDGYKVIVPDLPGFGKTGPPSEVWGVEDYADFVFSFAEAIGWDKFSLLGHSFGGQVAIQYSLTYPHTLETLILAAAAGIRRKPGVKVRTIKYIAKILGFFLQLIPSKGLREGMRYNLYMAIRKPDYERVQGVMREVFRRVISQDLGPLLSGVKTPTLVVWGEKDDSIPVEDAYTMKKNIPEAQLEVIPNINHDLNFKAPDKLAEATHRYISSHT